MSIRTIYAIDNQQIAQYTKLGNFAAQSQKPGAGGIEAARAGIRSFL
jgi:hypothetical protein